MPRNLDMVALRSFVGVVDAGGVTRAAGLLNLTQSAVSMQIRRLEEMLDLRLFDRSGRSLALTTDGELLLGHARRMLAVNDEVLQQLASDGEEGEIVLGVPEDIVYPAIPQVLQRFTREFLRTRVQLVSSATSTLKGQFARGEAHVVLTTEETVDAGGETLAALPMVWVGAPNGVAWKGRPLKLAFEYDCIFRLRAQAALDRAGISWEMAVESDSTRAIEASVSADLAVHTVLAGSEPPYLERIAHGGVLPELPAMRVNLYVATPAHDPAVEVLADLIRHAYAPRGRLLAG